MQRPRIRNIEHLLFIFLMSACSLISQTNKFSKNDSLGIEKSSYSLRDSNSQFTMLTLNQTEEFDPFETDINYPALAGVGAAFVGTSVAVHLYQQQAWWSDQREDFHIQNDWGYALGIDKIGHAYGTMLIEHGISSGLEAANLSPTQCVWYGSVGALLFQTFIEIEDGFGPQWGFSPGDFYADVIGAAYPVVQYYYPYMKNFMLKASYWPADLDETNPVSGQKHIIADDYHGQKFWLSARMKNVLPKSIGKVWPEFLMFAVGMGVQNLDGSGGGQRDFYIALDYDAETIPLYGSFWQFIKNTLNFLHFPMPGIRVNNGVEFFVFCY